MRPLVPPKLNTVHTWPEMDIEDLEMGIREAWPINEVAHYLRRTEKEVQGKARELFGKELPQEWSACRSDRNQSRLLGTILHVSFNAASELKEKAAPGLLG